MKKVSDTISQQKKARQDFLELKRMQSGDIKPEPVPDKESVKPKKFKDKLENFWFHYKYHTIALILTTAVLSVIVSQCMSRVNWDMQVVYFTYTPILDEQLQPVSDYFEEICPDINQDGEVNVNIVNCSLSPESNKQYNQAVLTKLQAMISAEAEAMLYITDSNSVTFFNTDSLKDFFATEQLSLTGEFYSSTENEYWDSLPEGLQIAARKIKGTTLEKNKDAKKIYTVALEILKEIREKQSQ